MSTISLFINYRRNDNEGLAGRIHDRLKDPFYSFFDTDEIELGDIINTKIKQGIESCDFFIPIFGRNYAKEFKKRENKRDYVLQEIEYAIEKEKQILPLLLEGAQIPQSPKESELPDKVYQTLSQHIFQIDSFNITQEKFEIEIEYIIKRIKELKREQIYQKPKKRKPTPKSNIQFNELESRLKNKDWQSADQETTRLILDAISNKRKKHFSLTSLNINLLNPEDLIIIDRLWAKYSSNFNAQFGFNEQLSLISENELSLEKDSDYLEIFETFNWKKGLECNFEGDHLINGSYPTPVVKGANKHNLSTNRTAFRTLINTYKENSDD